MTTARISKSAEQLKMAIIKAKVYGDPPPRTAADVEALLGEAYYGPNPEDIGRSYSVPVHTWASDHWM